MVYPTRQQALALKQQNQKLVEALRELETRHITNQEVSQQVVRLSAELRVTANQQASGSQEQAASLTQVNSSITELSSTAVQIAELAQQVSGFTEAMARGSHQIEETTQLSATQSQQGINAIQRTLRVSQEVAELYHQLQATLYDLNTKSSSMRQILILLNSVTAETHLLALNAAIEAASAGQYGERFKVVAHEVKQLANRSQQASQQVVDIIREMEKATLYSVTSVETGYQKAQEMEQVAGEAGFVIKEMRQVSVQAQEQANTISLLANEVQKLGELIRLTTTQQRSASQQVLGAVSEVSIVARQNAEGSVNISSTVEYLEEMSGSLALDLAA
jgi:methyl-accepting chemotaxis protein